MTFESPVFVTYVIAATVMILKMMGQGWITVARMMKVGGGFLNPEDAAGGMVMSAPDLARVYTALFEVGANTRNVISLPNKAGYRFV